MNIANENSEKGDLLLKIKAKYKGLSKGQKAIAAYILENYDKAAFITAYKMGRLTGVSESTVVRFAYTMGYDGYPELQKALHELIRNKLTSVQRIQLTSDMNYSDIASSVIKADMGNLRYTLESVDNAVFDAVIERMFKAHRIYVIGNRSASPLAQLLSFYLGFVMENVTLVGNSIGDAFDNIVNIGQEDMCIGISFPRYSNATVDCMRFAKSKNADIVAITDSHFSPLAELADHLLIARSDMASFADSLVAPLSIINAIIVACSLKHKEEVSERLDRLEEIWNSQQVYSVKNGAAER